MIGERTRFVETFGSLEAALMSSCPQFMFSPLMSPALTSHSIYSQASSLPPSGSCAPINHQSMNPAEFFSPLSSPAITPQNFQPPDYQGRNSLQGLVDQTKALAFDATTINALQQHGSPHALYGVNPGRSPRMVATGDAGVGTAAGSGRRGAGSKKSRPSPLLKPTPDTALRRKKGPGGPEKRSGSMGSGGVHSATTSPFMGPTMYGTPSSSTGTNAGGSSARASPTEGADHSGGSINTPSPVDLTMSETPTSSQLPSFMGPPPPPSASRRVSLTNGAVDNTAWLNPVTPATFMNFPSDLASAGLTSQDHQTFHQHGGGSHDVTPTDHSALASQDTSFIDTPLLLSSTAAAKSVPDLGPAPKARAKKLAPAPAPPSSTVGESSTAAAKGKGRAGSVSGPASRGGRKGVTKPMSSKALSGPSPKIKPLLGNGERVPLLARGASADLDASADVPSDALSRLSAKSNYQNILDGRGTDLLGLDATTLSALSTTQGADNRRTSHKAAEQKRRDSLKQCFEELRRILPPMASNANDEDRRPGEGNVGGQRGGSVDPENPNRGVSKVALLRRSNEYVGTLHDRVDRRDLAIEALRAKLEKLRGQVGEEGGDELEGFDLDALDKDEKKAGTMESCAFVSVVSRLPADSILLSQTSASIRTTRWTTSRNRRRWRRILVASRTRTARPSPNLQDLDARHATPMPATTRKGIPPWTSACRGCFRWRCTNGGRIN